MLDYESVSVGIDIGSSKTVVVVSQMDPFNGSLLILGVGEVPNAGVKRGKIVDLNSTALSIQKAAETAMLMSGIEFHNANINIPGEVESLNSQGIVTVSRKDREVKIKDVERVVEQAQSVNMKTESTILHLFPQFFTLDEHEKIKDPVGMTGLRLQGSVHLILKNKSSITNVVKCFNKADISPLEGVFAGYASAKTTLSNEDKELGVLLVDIGAGSCDVIGFEEGIPVISTSISLGGDAITRDLSIGLKVSEQTAENIKCEHGCAMTHLVDPLSEVEVAGIREGEINRISQQKIAEVIQPRVEEIFLLMKQKLENKNIDLSSFSSLVLTGGTSFLRGIAETAESVTNIPTRIGFPRNIGGLSEKVNTPIYSTVIGLCLPDNHEINVKGGMVFSSQAKSTNLVGKMKSFFKDMLG